MNDLDLDSKLKTVRVPERGEDYWEDFPRSVAMELRAVGVTRGARGAWLPRFALGSGIAFACFAIGFCIGNAETPKAISHALLKNPDEFRQKLVQLSDRVRTSIQDKHAPRTLVEDQ